MWPPGLLPGPGVCRHGNWRHLHVRYHRHLHHCGLHRGLVKEHGGIQWLIEFIHRRVKSKKGAQLGIAGLVAAVDVATANNTVAIVMSGSIAKEISEEYHIDPRRSASLLDIFASVMQASCPMVPSCCTPPPGPGWPRWRSSPICSIAISWRCVPSCSFCSSPGGRRTKSAVYRPGTCSTWGVRPAASVSGPVRRPPASSRCLLSLPERRYHFFRPANTRDTSIS